MDHILLVWVCLLTNDYIIGFEPDSASKDPSFLNSETLLYPQANESKFSCWLHSASKNNEVRQRCYLPPQGELRSRLRRVSVRGSNAGATFGNTENLEMIYVGNPLNGRPDEGLYRKGKAFLDARDAAKITLLIDNY
eukprot:6185955-Pleurochrysis_carterae.AAC.1